MVSVGKKYTERHAFKKDLQGFLSTMQGLEGACRLVISSLIATCADNLSLLIAHREMHRLNNPLLPRIGRFSDFSALNYFLFRFLHSPGIFFVRYLPDSLCLITSCASFSSMAKTNSLTWVNCSVFILKPGSKRDGFHQSP